MNGSEFRPIGDLFDDLQDYGPSIGAALDECVVRIDEVGPVVVRLVEEFAATGPLPVREANIVYFGLHVCAQARAPSALCAPLLAALRRPQEELEQMLGDTLTEHFNRILIGVFDGDAESLLAFAADPGVHEHQRSAAVEAAAFLAWEGRVALPRIHEALAGLASASIPAKDFGWVSWAHAVALLGFRDLAPAVEAAVRRGMLGADEMDYISFQAVLDDASTVFEDRLRFGLADIGYLESATEALVFEDDVRREAKVPSHPVRNAFRDVGRNDPCPCGSGKKYKKCCLR